MSIEELVLALQGIIDAAKNPDGTERDLTDEEAARYSEIEGQLAVARRSVEIRSRQRAYTTPTGAPVVTAANPDRAEAHARAFDTFLRTGTVSAELAEFRAQGEGLGSAGGYLVPTTFRQRLVERLLAYGGFAAEAETLNTSAGEPIEWPTLDDTANVGEIVAEGGTFAAGADLVFGTATLGAYKYMSGGAGNLPLKVSWELLQDSAFSVEDLLVRVFGNRIGRLQAVHWLTGSGVGEPQGLLTPKTAFDEITSNAAGPSVAELVGTVHALDPAYRQGAKWLMNDTTLGLLRGQLDGNDRPLWQAPTEGLSPTMPGGTLLGYPVVIDQAMPDIGDQTKFLAFGNYRDAYVIRRVQDVTLVRLNELYAANGQVGFLAWARGDGAVQDPNAYVVLAGQNV